MYVYRYAREDQLYTVGYYDPAGSWCPESDHGSLADAATRVAQLNGGGPMSVQTVVTSAAGWPVETLAFHLLCAMCCHGDHNVKAPAPMSEDAISLADWFLRVVRGEAAK